MSSSIDYNIYCPRPGKAPEDPHWESGEQDESQCEVEICGSDLCSVSQSDGQESERENTRGVLRGLPMPPQISDSDSQRTGSWESLSSQSARAPVGVWEASDGSS